MKSGYYFKERQQRINHLLCLDNLYLNGKNEIQISSLVNIDHCFVLNIRNRIWPQMVRSSGIKKGYTQRYRIADRADHLAKRMGKNILRFFRGVCLYRRKQKWPSSRNLYEDFGLFYNEILMIHVINAWAVLFWDILKTYLPGKRKNYRPWDGGLGNYWRCTSVLSEKKKKGEKTDKV